MKRRIALTALVAAGGLAAAAGLAYAQQGPFAAGNDAVSVLAGARINLVQAIASAEQHAGGRATRAHLEHEKGASIFDVEVVTPANTVMDVKVDADGRVVAATQDAQDEEDAQESDGQGEHDD